MAREALALLRSVREVAALARPDGPASVSQRAFDAAAEARSRDDAALPAARRIAEQLGLPWHDVLTVAHAHEKRQAQLLGVKTRASPAADWITEENVTEALRLIAARLGTDSLSARAYRVERARLLAEDRARWMHGGWLLLPDDEQVIATTGSWEDALLLAGLEPSLPASQATAPPLVDLLERFHDAHGFQASARELRAFARGNGIPYPSERSQRFSAAIAEWKASRRARGLPEPRVITRVGGRGHKAPEYSDEVSAARDGERRRAAWTRERCAAAVARYLAALRPGERSTQRGYSDWATMQPSGSVPTMSTIQEHDGWEAARREAQEGRGRVGSWPASQASGTRLHNDVRACA